MGPKTNAQNIFLASTDVVSKTRSKCLVYLQIATENSVGFESAVPNPFLKFCNQFELTKRFCRSSFVQLLTLGIFLKIMTFQIYQKNNVLGAQLLTSLKIDLCHDLNVFIVIQMPQRKIYLKELIGTDKQSGLNISNMKERFQ